MATMWKDRMLALVDTIAGAIVIALAIAAYKCLDDKLATTYGVLVAGGLIVCGFGFILGRRLKRDVSKAAQKEIELGLTYSEHTREVLATLRDAISGNIPGATLDDFIKIGILERAERILTQGPNETIRLSILQPAKSDPSKWAMNYSVGHSFEGAKKFDMDIAGSFSGTAYSTGNTQYSGDVDADAGFNANEHAKPDRGYSTLISVPLRDGKAKVGVFNALSTNKHAFSNADRAYIEVLGGILSLTLVLAQQAVTTQQAPKK